MSDGHQAPRDAASGAGVEADTLPVGQIALWVLALLGFVGGLVVALWQYFDAVTQRAVVAQDLSQIPPALPELRARDRQLLSHYEVVDAARGRFGDVALVAREPVSFDDPADSGPFELIGRHGSLTTKPAPLSASSRNRSKSGPLANRRSKTSWPRLPAFHRKMYPRTTARR